MARFRLFDAVTSAVRAASSRRPCLLVIDDLHLADLASIRLLGFLAPQLRTMRVMVVATCRDSELSPTHPLVEALPDLLRHSRRLQLEGLSSTEVGELVAGLTSSRPSQPLASALHERTAGNPLFIRELVRLLQTQAGIEHLTQLAPGLVPETVRGVLAHRLAPLSPPSRDALVAAAVIAPQFDVDVLHETTGIERARLLDLLDEAVAARIVSEAGTGRYAFVHALFRDAVYSGLGAVRDRTPARRALTLLPRQVLGRSGHVHVDGGEGTSDVEVAALLERLAASARWRPSTCAATVATR